MRTRRLSHHEEEGEGGHFARPWVWVMVDAFFLITAFFVCTFRVKTNENVLPQKLSAGVPGGTAVTDNIFKDRVIHVHVTHEGGVAQYQYHSIRGTLDDLKSSLAGAKETAGSVKVRVSYESGVPFGDVMAVMNASARAGIRDVGFSPIRISERPAS